MKEADSVCPEFDRMLFPAMHQVILADGEVTSLNGLATSFF